MVMTHQDSIQNLRVLTNKANKVLTTNNNSQIKNNSYIDELKDINKSLNDIKDNQELANKLNLTFLQHKYKLNINKVLNQPKSSLDKIQRDLKSSVVNFPNKNDLNIEENLKNINNNNNNNNNLNQNPENMNNINNNLNQNLKDISNNLNIKENLEDINNIKNNLNSSKDNLTKDLEDVSKDFNESIKDNVNSNKDLNESIKDSTKSNLGLIAGLVAFQAFFNNRYFETIKEDIKELKENEMVARVQGKAVELEANVSDLATRISQELGYHRDIAVSKIFDENLQSIRDLEKEFRKDGQNEYTARIHSDFIMFESAVDALSKHIDIGKTNLHFLEDLVKSTAYISKIAPDIDVADKDITKQLVTNFHGRGGMDALINTVTQAKNISQDMWVSLDTLINAAESQSKYFMFMSRYADNAAESFLNYSKDVLKTAAILEDSFIDAEKYLTEFQKVGFSSLQDLQEEFTRYAAFGLDPLSIRRMIQEGRQEEATRLYMEAANEFYSRLLEQGDMNSVIEVAHSLGQTMEDVITYRDYAPNVLTAVDRVPEATPQELDDLAKYYAQQHHIDPLERVGGMFERALLDSPLSGMYSYMAKWDLSFGSIFDLLNNGNVQLLALMAFFKGGFFVHLFGGLKLILSKIPLIKSIPGISKIAEASKLKKSAKILENLDNKDEIFKQAYEYAKKAKVKDDLKKAKELLKQHNLDKLTAQVKLDNLTRLSNIEKLGFGKSLSANILSKIPGIKNLKSVKQAVLEQDLIKNKKLYAEILNLKDIKSKLGKPIDDSLKQLLAKHKLPMETNLKDLLKITKESLKTSEVNLNNFHGKSLLNKKGLFSNISNVFKSISKSPFTMNISAKSKSALEYLANILNKATPTLNKFGKVLGKVAPGLIIASEGFEAYSKVAKGEKTIGEAVADGAIQATATLGGMKAGAAIGAAIGTVIAPGVGTAIGGVLGGIVGAFGGSQAANSLELVEKYRTDKNKEEQLENIRKHARESNIYNPYDIFGGQSIKIDGSHSSGLRYVPKDNYIGLLHKGEAVLNKPQAEDWRASEEFANRSKSILRLSSLATETFKSITELESKLQTNNYNNDISNLNLGNIPVSLNRSLPLNLGSILVSLASNRHVKSFSRLLSRNLSNVLGFLGNASNISSSINRLITQPKERFMNLISDSTASFKPNFLTRLTSRASGLGELISKPVQAISNLFQPSDRTSLRGLSRNEFIKFIGQKAINAAPQSRLLPSIVVAQAALESAWGRSTIKNANNLFGIKWHRRDGIEGVDYVIVNTKEQDRYGREFTIRDKFRMYDSYEESIIDHTKFLNNNRRYANVLSARNYEQAARALQAAGYATDINYANKLIDIIRRNRLYLLDRGEVPKFARGAIVDKPTLGIFGEAGSEALIPLSPDKRERGLDLWRAAGEELGVKVNPNINYDSPKVEIDINTDGVISAIEILTKVVDKKINQVIDNISKSNKTTTPIQQRTVKPVNSMQITNFI